MGPSRTVIVIAAVCAAGPAFAQPPPPEPEPEPAPVVTTPVATPPAPEPAAPRSPPATLPFQLRGFVSQGAYITTANDYIGESSRGSVELFEAGLNVSTEVADRLRAGIQLYAREIGQFRDVPPRLDWAFLDYHYKPWLGMRAGIIKLPLGLYNEYADVDAARTAILMPQGVYRLRDRSTFQSHTGFGVYGTLALGGAGTLDYQAFLGTLTVPENALVLSGARLDGIDTKYVTGGQVFWTPPVEGLRIGATYLRLSVDFDLTLDAANIAALIMAGVVPADYDGKLVISQRPAQIYLGSVEYIRGDWVFAAEYSRWLKHQQSTLPVVLPAFDQDSERFYVMANRRWSERIETGVYYSVYHVDVDDRRGRDKMKFPVKEYAFQRDAAATLRVDVNEHWLWKLEAHFMDGTADIFGSDDPDPERYWGLFLVKTTVTF